MLMKTVADFSAAEIFYLRNRNNESKPVYALPVHQAIDCQEIFSPYDFPYIRPLFNKSQEIRSKKGYCLEPLSHLQKTKNIAHVYVDNPPIMVNETLAADEKLKVLGYSDFEYIPELEVIFIEQNYALHDPQLLPKYLRASHFGGIGRLTTFLSCKYYFQLHPSAQPYDIALWLLSTEEATPKYLDYGFEVYKDRNSNADNELFMYAGAARQFLTEQGWPSK